MIQSMASQLFFFFFAAVQPLTGHFTDEEEHRHIYKEVSVTIPERCSDNYC